MPMMKPLLQIAIALGIFNVWLLRYDKSTPWRGGTARNLKEEFAAYGLSIAFMRSIGALKISCAALLMAGLWWPVLIKPAAGVLAVLMMGAIAMHWRIKDPAQRSLPAFTMLLLTLALVLLP